MDPPDRGLVHEGSEGSWRGTVEPQAERRAKARADRDRPFIGIDDDHRIPEVAGFSTQGCNGRQSRLLYTSLYKKVFRKSGCDPGANMFDRRILPNQLAEPGPAEVRGHQPRL